LLTDVQPFSAAIPTDVMAAPIPAISQAVNHTSVPVPAILCIKFVISDSVAAKLLPKSTTALPNLSTSVKAVQVTLAILENCNAACSRFKSVDTSNAANVSVNLPSCSNGIPICQPNSAILASSS
jgi:hypothetical protein